MKRSEFAGRKCLGVAGILLLMAQPAYASTQTASLGLASGAVLHLHAGLNVAALYCRKGNYARVADGFATVRARHRVLLAESFEAERRRTGPRALDRRMTKLYNSFANPQSLKSFCRVAADIADQATAMDSESLANAAPEFIASLENPS